MVGSPLQHEILREQPASTQHQHVTITAPSTHIASWTLFPAPTRPRTMSSSTTTTPRRPLKPRAPPSTPSNVSPRGISSHNAGKLAEVCRVAPRELRRGLSFSSVESVPDMMTDEYTDSDASNEDTYQATMAELFDTYHDLSASRYSNQDFETSKPRLPVSWSQDLPVSLPALSCHQSDRSWACETSTDLHVPLPSPGLPKPKPKPQEVPYVRRAPARKGPHKRLPVAAVFPSAPIAPPPTGPLPPVPRSAASLDKSPSSWTTRKPVGGHPLPPLPAPRRGSAPLVRPSTAPSQRVTSATASLPPMPKLEKSVWEYDDDDDENVKGLSSHGSIGSSLAAKLHMRTQSAGSHKDVASKETSGDEKSGRKSRRSASEVFRGIFGIDKK